MAGINFSRMNVNNQRSVVLLLIWRLLFSFIDFFAVTGAKHDNVVALYVEDHAIIADAETVATEFRVSQTFGVLERIVLEAKEGCADAVFDTSVKSVNVFNGFLCIYQPVAQCPNTSSCVLIRPAL